MKGPLARNTIQTAAVLGLRTVTQALSLLLLTRLLGVDKFGILVSASSLAVVLGIVPSLGAGYVMLAQAPKRADAIEHVWRYAWPLMIAIGLALIAIYLPSAQMIAREHALPFGLLLWIAATELLVAPFTSLFSFALQAQGRIPLSQIIQWLPFGFRLIAILPCFALDETTSRLSLYVALQFMAASTGLALSASITKKYLKLDWRPRLASKQEITNGARYSAMHVVAANASDFDKILSIHWLSPQDIGAYAATTRVVSALTMPIVALLLSAQPRIFQYAHRPTADGRRLIKLIGLLALAWGVASWIILHTSTPIIVWLFGPGFVTISQLIPALAIVCLPLALRQTAGVILVALGKPLGRICFELSGVAILFCSILALVPPNGVTGLANALIVSESAMAIIGWALIYKLIRLD